jgi:hypothetical protein
MIASSLRWVLYAAAGVVATITLYLVVLVAGNSLHLWGGQHPTNSVRAVDAPKLQGAEKAISGTGYFKPLGAVRSRTRPLWFGRTPIFGLIGPMLIWAPAEILILHGR